MTDHRTIFERVADVHNRRDWNALAEVFHDDYVEEYPQSGEVFRGLANVRAVREHRPDDGEAGTIEADTVRLVTDPERWVRTPAFTVVRVTGSGDTGTGIFRARYPDGSVWWNVIVHEVRDGKVAKATLYFAPVFDPPDWRAAYREH